MATPVELGLSIPGTDIHWFWTFDWRNPGEKLSGATARATDSLKQFLADNTAVPGASDIGAAVLWNGQLDADHETEPGRALMVIWSKIGDSTFDETKAFVIAERQQMEAEAPPNRQG